MPTDYTFQGWVAPDDNPVNANLVFEKFEPKVWDEDDVDVRILYCSICASDPTVLSGVLTGTKKGTCAGHELAGQVVKVGNEVENGLKVGDMVGIGAQSDCCRHCKHCMEGNENHCPAITLSFGGIYQRRNAGQAGSAAKGGFAKYWRGPSRFAIPVPKGLDPAYVGPLMCAGITVYAPLLRYGAGEKGKRVGVIGIGGTGHLGILFAKAMGAEVTAISRDESKKGNALELGATHYIVSGNNVAEAVQGHERSLDIVICTIDPEKFPELRDYLKLLDAGGVFVLVGLPAEPLSVPSFPLVMGAVSITGSLIGSPKEIKQMFQLATEQRIHPWIQRYDMDDINQALIDFKAGKPRYRIVLVNKDNGGVL